MVASNVLVLVVIIGKFPSFCLLRSFAFICYCSMPSPIVDEPRSFEQSHIQLSAACHCSLVCLGDRSQKEGACPELGSSLIFTALGALPVFRGQPGVREAISH